MTTTSDSGSQKLCANNGCRNPIQVTTQTWKCPNGCFITRCVQCSKCDACLDPPRCILPSNPAIAIAPVSMQISEGMSLIPTSSITFPSPAPAAHPTPCLLNSSNTQLKVDVSECPTPTPRLAEIKNTLAKGTSQIRASHMIKHKTALGIEHSRPRNLFEGTPHRIPFSNNQISPRNPLSRVPPATPMAVKNKTNELSIHNPLSRVLPSTPVAVANNQITNKEKEFKMRSTDPSASSTGNRFLNSTNIGSRLFAAIKAQSRNRNGRSRTARKDDQMDRYKPKITDEELKQISRSLKAKVTPLFEKKLTASDAGRIGRLVLPKRCAETYLPPVKELLGDPLTIQDLRGNDWVLNFRFWPNNNSRMYVLEGFSSLVKSMDLIEGDTVTFNKLEPEGKLVMGYRKAKIASSSNQVVATLSPHNDVSKGNTSSTRLCSDSQVKPNNTTVIESEVVRAETPVRARRSSKMGSTSKAIIEPEKEMVELDLTSKEAQDLVRPPLGSDDPNTMVIDGVEIIAYKDDPVIGRPTIVENFGGGIMILWGQCLQCFKWRKVPLDVLLPADWTCSQNQWDPQRSKCSDIEEKMSDTTTKNIFRTTNDQGSPKRMKIGDQQPETAVARDTTVAVIPDENVAAVKTTTKHPRHRPGCSCIVCIQAPSGTKHNSTCTCGGCMTVRRRHQTVNSRRGKKPSGPTRRKRTQRLGKPASINQKKPSPEPDNSIGKQAEQGASSSAQQPTSTLNLETEKPTEHHQITESSSASIPADTNINERCLFDLNMLPEPEDDE